MFPDQGTAQGRVPSPIPPSSANKTVSVLKNYYELLVKMPFGCRIKDAWNEGILELIGLFDLCIHESLILLQSKNARLSLAPS